MELKIGDKVRIIKNPYDWIRGSEGVITEVRKPTREYRYRLWLCSKETKRSFYYPVRDGEIEKVSEKGKQLEFAFMGEE